MVLWDVDAHYASGQHWRLTPLVVGRAVLVHLSR